MNLNKVLFSAEISYTAKIGMGLRINHSIGVVIGGGVNIGENFTTNQGVTIGGNFGKKRFEQGINYSQPQIGNNTSVSAGARILGPVIVGDHVIIGANSVVLKDIENSMVAVGAPAKAIKQRSDTNGY